MIESNDKYLIIKILFVKITLKKKMPKSDLYDFENRFNDKIEKIRYNNYLLNMSKNINYNTFLKYKNIKNFWTDLCFIFIFSGALCSLIDKLFYGGSLDFIGISDLFIADFKDIYINLGLLFFIMSCYKGGFFSQTEETSLKDDWNSIKKFLNFIKNDILQILKKEKV